MEQFCTKSYGTSGRLSQIQAIVSAGIIRPRQKRLVSASSFISVLRRPDQKPLPHGLSPDDIRLAANAAKLIERLGLQLYYAVVADRYRPEWELREKTRKLKSDIVRAQRLSGVTPGWWLQMDEGSPAWHANILFPLGGPKGPRLYAGLKRSALFDGDVLDVQEADGAAWFVSYCSEERAPQAKYVHGVGKLMPRKIGSHHNGEGGGNRVHLSLELEAFMREEGGLAKRRKVYRSRALPKCTKPVQYVEPVQIALPLAAPAIDIRALVENKRREIGLSQNELAARHLGMKQAGYSNAFVRRHDSPSPWVIRRALEFVGARISI